MRPARDHFDAVADRLDTLVGAHETALLWFEAETSRFARLNATRVRQAGTVDQRSASVQLVDGQRHAHASLDLGGTDEDGSRLAAAVAMLREQVARSAPDPLLLLGDAAHDSVDVRCAELPEAAEVLAELLGLASGLDLVGIWASGATARGFARSGGARRWHSRESFNLDWSVHAGAELAVKNRLAGERWQPGGLRLRLEADRERLALLSRPPRTPAVGGHRAYLAPAALAELMGLLAWGGFGVRGLRTGQSALSALARGERRMSAAVTLRERLAQGLAPAFTRDGFELPAEVTLVGAGRFASALASPRSACEYDLPVNSADEMPHALDMDAGQLDGTDPATLLGDGIEVANLWYCNHVDRNECRVTGTTRFASFVVANGRRVAPLAAMRFDDSLYGVLGDRLAGLTREREMRADPGSYGQRSLGVMNLPGALVDGLRLVE